MTLEENGFIDLFFADGSGFSLTPYIPYGWQKKGITVSIPSQRSGQINVFGLLSRDNEFESYTTMGSVNSQLIISYIDDFAQKIKRKTVIVMDNAPTHKSLAFRAKIEEWKEQDLYIWFLPTYSPHLNIIEILWRKIKYEWLRPKDYCSKETLLEALENILNGVGNEFKIKFKCFDKVIAKCTG